MSNEENEKKMSLAVPKRGAAPFFFARGIKGLLYSSLEDVILSARVDRLSSRLKAAQQLEGGAMR